jgi:hypothetical protein
MAPDRRMPAEEQCPVSDQTLGALYGASSEGLGEVIATVPPEARAVLAMYCYRRAHLASIGLAVAAMCDEADLTHSGGYPGSLLFAKSREASKAPQIPSPFGRRQITLASGLLRKVRPIDDEIDEESSS